MADNAHAVGPRACFVTRVARPICTWFLLCSRGCDRQCSLTHLATLVHYITSWSDRGWPVQHQAAYWWLPCRGATCTLPTASRAIFCQLVCGGSATAAAMFHGCRVTWVSVESPHHHRSPGCSVRGGTLQHGIANNYPRSVVMPTSHKCPMWNPKPQQHCAMHASNGTAHSAGACA